MNRLLNLIASLLFISSSLPCFADAGDPNHIQGLWLTPSLNALLTINVENQSLSIFLKSTLEPEQLDEHNPNPKLRNNMLAGKNLGKGFQYVNGWWRGGSLYDPESGKTYKAKLKLNDKDSLEIRAYIGTSLLGRTMVLQRKSKVLQHLNLMLDMPYCLGDI